MAEMLDLGTLYLCDRLCIELRILGVGEVGIAVQGPPSWKWVILRTWKHPVVPTKEDLNHLYRALDIVDGDATSQTPNET